jgi:hypothetical protein
MESIERVKRVTSRPQGSGGGSAPCSPRLTRSLKSLSASIGAAMERPIQAAEMAAAAPSTRLITMASR